MRKGRQELDREKVEMTAHCETAEKKSLLIDVTAVAKKAGFLYPVRVSRSLQERCLRLRSQDADVTDEDRVWMFLYNLRTSHPGPDPCPDGRAIAPQ
jgi:hypothetical protein